MAVGAKKKGKFPKRRHTPCNAPLPFLEWLESRRLLSAAVQNLPFVTPLASSSTLAQPTSFSPTYQLLTSPHSLSPLQTAGPQGYSPSQVLSAYGINQISFNGITGDGTGQTIAIIDAYNDPTIQADLQAFDAAFGLPNTTLRVVAQDGSNNLPTVDPAGKGNNWEGEEALDVEWAHAIAPGATILLVEAKNASPSNLFSAVNWARQQPGVSVVSMSFGGSETSSETQYDSFFTTPAGHGGVTFVASTGDAGTPAGYPAYSPNVVAIGGTSLSINSLGTYQSETGWSGSGGGISQVESQPTYQKDVVTQSSVARTAPDVSFDADPFTGVSVYDSYNNGTSKPWEVVGGTSLAAPSWAALIAIANQGRTLAGQGTLDSRSQTLPLLYSAPSTLFHDITAGNNGFAARSGYDLVTGRGSPIANLLIPYLVSGTVPTPPTTGGPTIASITASSITLTEGTPLTLTANGVSDPGGTGLAVTFYEETNGTPGLQTGVNGDFAFTPVTDGSNAITLDTSNASGTFTFYAQLTDAQGNASPDGTNAPTVTITIVPSTSNGPSVASISASPNPVMSGDVLTLTANGVTDPNSSVRRVYFYEETNGIPGLQTGFGGDLAVRATSSSSGYTSEIDTTGIAGNITFYALAVDFSGNTSAIGTSAPSTTVSITAAVLPGAPTNLVATAVSSSEIDLSFSESDSSATGFILERATTPTFRNATKLFTINRPDVITYDDTNLAPNTRYYYRVAAFNNAGASDFSNTASAITPLAATHLVFAQQPGNTAAGQTFPTLTVYLENAHNQIATDDNSTVTISLASGTAGAHLSGTLTVQAQAGVAVFSGLSLSTAGKFILAATDGGLKAARSRAFTVEPDTADDHLVIAQQPVSTIVGRPLSPIVVEMQDPFGNLVKTAPHITLSVTAGPGVLEGATSRPAAKGIAQFKNLWFNAPGSYTLQASDGTSTTNFTQEATIAATAFKPLHVARAYHEGHTINISASLLSSTILSHVPFSGTATITDQNNNTISTANVAANGTIRFILTGLAAGAYSLTVNYSGDASHTSATSTPFTVNVVAAAAHALKHKKAALSLALATGAELRSARP